MQLKENTALAALVAASLGLAGPYAHASGFAVPEISIFGLGTSNAVVANATELGAIAYNPAISGFYSGLTLSGGVNVVVPSLEATTATGSHESGGRDLIPVPMFQATYGVNDKITLGLGANAPFGLETKWAPGVFPGFAGIAPAAHPTSSKIELADIVPTFAYRIAPNTAVALGADYYYARKIQFSAVGLESEGDGDGWGWNASLIHTMNDWSFGLSYRSKATVDIEGTSSVPGLSQPASADVPLPWRAQAGVRYQVNSALAVEFDITRTGWGGFDTLEIKNGALLPDVVSATDWKDANAYRLGATYELNSQTQLRFGYSYDKTPQPRDSFSARIPDNDRHLLSVGFGHDLGDGLAIEGGYMFVKFEGYTHNVAGLGPSPVDPLNGSFVYNGKYDSHVHLIGLGVSKSFN